jgi:hypothetical protein
VIAPAVATVACAPSDLKKINWDFVNFGDEGRLSYGKIEIPK